MRSPDRPLSIAVLGCGHMAERHARTMRRTDPAVQVGFASRDAARAADFARRHGGFAHWPSYQGALEDDRVDAVLIVTPPASHLPLALEALRAGRHVIVEKPAFLRSRDVDVAEAAAQAAGRRVLVAENYAYKPLAAALRRIVASGELGDIRFVQVNALKRGGKAGWRDDPRQAGGGALFEGGVHWLDLLANLGLGIESVSGFRPGPCDAAERAMLVVARYAGGAVGTLHHAWDTPGRLRGLQLSRIAGTEGSVTFESNGLFAHVFGRRSRWLVPGLRDIEGFRAMFADFFGALRDDRAPLMTTARSRHVLELVEQAMEVQP